MQKHWKGELFEKVCFEVQEESRSDFILV